MELVEGAFDVAGEDPGVIVRRRLPGVEAGKPGFRGLAGSEGGRPPALEPAGELIGVAPLLDQAAGVQKSSPGEPAYIGLLSTNCLPTTVTRR